MKMKKLFSVLLAVVMIFGCINSTDYAYASDDGDLGADNTIEVGTWDLTTIDGETISNKQEGVVSILVFAGLKSCVNSRTTVENLCNAEWMADERVRLIIIDYDLLDLDTYKAKAANYNCENALFAYRSDDDVNGEDIMWSYVEALWGLDKLSIHAPLTVITDANNTIRYCYEGELLAKEIRPCVENLIGEELEGADVANPDQYTEVQIEGTFNEQYAREVLELVNEARATKGLAALTMDEKLMEKAMQRAAECAVLFGHTRPDNTKFNTVLDRIYRAYCAENVAAGQKTPEGVMSDWLESAGHYANIMSKSATSIGIGSFTIDGYTYWAQLFSDYTDTENQSYEDYTTTAAVTAHIDKINPIVFGYSGDVTVGNTTVTTTKNKNIVNDFYVKSHEMVISGVTFESLNPEIVTVATDGALTGVSVGKAYVNIYVNGNLVCTETVRVKAGSATVPSPEPSVEPTPSDEPTPGPSDEPTPSNEPTPGPSDEPIPSNEPTPGPSDEPTPSDEPDDVVKGDANEDKAVTLEDANLALKAALGIVNLEGYGLKAADVDGKEGVSLEDANLILKAALGIINLNEE